MLGAGPLVLLAIPTGTWPIAAANFVSSFGLAVLNSLWSSVVLSLFPSFFLKSIEYRTDNLWNTLWCVALVIFVTGPPTPLRWPVGEDTQRTFAARDLSGVDYV